jgi:transposase-like protein
MIHRNARLTPTGRRILVERVMSGRPVAHVAKEMGVSRTCAHRWIIRFRAHGWGGLQDRSSGPKSCPHATPVEVVADVLTQRVEHRAGPTELALRCGTSDRMVSRILARARHAQNVGPGPDHRGTDPGFPRHRPAL